MTRTTKLQRSIANFAAMLALCVTASAAAQDPAPAAQAPTAAQGETTGQFALRTSVEIGAGAAAQAAVWVPTTYAMIDAYNDCADDLAIVGPLACLGAGGPYAAVGLGVSTLLTPSSVYASGELAGGNGNYWYTLLGGTAGTAGGLLLAQGLFLVEGDTGAILGFSALMMSPVIGSMLGYELSQEAEIAEDRAEARAAFTITPSAGVTADGQGAMLSASGTF